MHCGRSIHTDTSPACTYARRMPDFTQAGGCLPGTAGGHCSGTLCISHNQDIPIDPGAVIKPGNNSK